MLGDQRLDGVVPRVRKPANLSEGRETKIGKNS